jgi:hypothetical protein
MQQTYHLTEKERKAGVRFLSEIDTSTFSTKTPLSIKNPNPKGYRPGEIHPNNSQKKR